MVQSLSQAEVRGQLDIKTISAACNDKAGFLGHGRRNHMLCPSKDETGVQNSLGIYEVLNYWTRQPSTRRFGMRLDPRQKCG